eukprot:TCONS_00002147-protein
MVKESKAMDRIILTSVKIKCLQAQLGCDWQGELSSVEKHEEKCKYKSIQCSNKGCRSEMMRMNLLKHLNNCQYQIVACEFCATKVPQIDMEDHRIDCDFCPKKCPNENCQVKIRNTELDAHLEQDCQYEPVECRYSAFGCEDKIKRIDMKLHLDESVHDHMSLLFKSNQDLEKSHRETKQELDDAQQRLVKTTMVLKEFNEMLNQTRRELEATKREFAAFRKETSEKIAEQDAQLEKYKNQPRAPTPTRIEPLKSPRDSPVSKSPRQSPEPGTNIPIGRKSPEPVKERRTPSPTSDDKKGGILKKAKSADNLTTAGRSSSPVTLKLFLKKSDSPINVTRSDSNASSSSSSSAGSTNPPPPQIVSKNPLSPLTPLSPMSPTKRVSPPPPGAKDLPDEPRSPQNGETTLQRKRQAAIKPIITRPSTPLQSIIDAMNNSPINDYPQHFHAMMQNMEPDRFYVVNGDLLIKVNTFGSLRPYAVVYVQPWEERSRKVFQEMRLNKRTKHHSERVCIEANSQVGIVKLLVNCTLQDTIVSVVCTQQNTAFLPSYIETMGWGFQVPAGLHRNAFFHQENMLLRLRQRIPDVERMAAGM